MITSAPSPELLNHVGHALLRSIAIGQGDILRHAAGALERLADLLPDASPEGRMIAVLLAVTDDQTSQPVVTSPAPQSQSQPTPARRQAKSGKQAKTSRKSKAAVPIMDINGRLISSKGINGIAVISQAEARKVLGMSCIQMLKLEDQKLLGRIQEEGLRHVWYPTQQVQKLLNLLDHGADPQPDDDDGVGEEVA